MAGFFGEKLLDDTFVMVIQVNGKARDNIQADVKIKEDGAKELALKSKKVIQFLGGKEVKKVIFVPGKLINLVV